MSAALAAEGENLTKLEKADVLELTVRHLHQLHREGELSLNGSAGLFQRSAAPSPTAPADRRRYQGGFLACAQQVASYVMKTPGLEPGLGQRLLAHLARCSQQLSPESATPSALGLAAGLPPILAVPDVATAANFNGFPSNLTLPVDYHASAASAAREYSITAQFQVYRPVAGPPQQPLRINPDLLPTHTSETLSGSSADESISPGIGKRRGSPVDFPNIPIKKRYNYHYHEADRVGRHSDSESEPVASTSGGQHSNDCSVVESQIGQLSPTTERSPSSTDGKDVDSMWRPW